MRGFQVAVKYLKNLKIDIREKKQLILYTLDISIILFSSFLQYKDIGY